MATTTIDEHATVDESLAVLQQHKDQWTTLPISEKLLYLKGLIDRTIAAATRWVSAAFQAKGIPDSSPLVGEEWISGPWAFLHSLNGMTAALKAAQEGKPRRPRKTRPRRDGQVIAEVFPLTMLDRLILNGYRSEVWMQPEVTLNNFTEHVGVFYKQKNPQGKVGL